MTVKELEGPFFEIDGVEYCDEEMALAALLKADILFANSRKYLEIDSTIVCNETIVLFVNCNDVFAWACGDAESLTMAEVPTLYRAWKADQYWGVLKWCCQKRNLKPQKSIVDDMKKVGKWDAEMEALRDNSR